jgi:hypothetical protein
MHAYTRLFGVIAYFDCPVTSLLECAYKTVSIYGYFAPDLPSEANFNEVWKNKCAGLSPIQRGNFQLIEAFKLADRLFPNIHEIFKLILTAPVGSVPCERSFSALRRLKDWSRSTMTENRLGLAMLYPHRDNLNVFEGLAKAI